MQNNDCSTESNCEYITNTQMIHNNENELHRPKRKMRQNYNKKILLNFI